MTSRSHTVRRLSLVAAAAAALGLAACNRAEDPRTAGQQLDSAVAKAEQKAEEAKDSVARGAEEMKRDMRDATNTASNAVADAAITASVNAELARDKELSALRIDVDTAGGRVVLRGTAPSEAARERAARLAQAVDGVRAVENQLVVERRS